MNSIKYIVSAAILSASPFVFAASAHAALVAPNDLNATAHAKSLYGAHVRLEWTDVSDSESLFIVERATSTMGAFVPLGTATSSPSLFGKKTFRDLSAVGTTTYMYRVYLQGTATTTMGAPYYEENGPKSNQVTVTMPSYSSPNKVTPLLTSKWADTVNNKIYFTIPWVDMSRSTTHFDVQRSTISPTDGYSLLGVVSSASCVKAQDIFLETCLARVTDAVPRNIASTYYYRIIPRNMAGSGYSGDAEVKTLIAEAGPEFVSTEASHITSTSTQVKWITDVGAMGYVQVATSTEFRSPIKRQDLNRLYAHNLLVGGLRSNTRYYARISAKADAGTTSNQYATSSVLSFRTATVATSTTPLQILDTQMLHITATSVNALWRTNKDSVGYLQLATSSAFSGARNIPTVHNSTVHSVQVNGLIQNTQYYAQIVARGLASSTPEEARSQIFSFTTLRAGTTTPPKIPVYKILSPNGGESVRAGDLLPITWTRENATSSRSTLRLVKYVRVCFDTTTCVSEERTELQVDAANTGVYQMRIPRGTIPATNYRVRVSDVATRSARDLSDNDFSILEATTTPPVASSAIRVTEVRTSPSKLAAGRSMAFNSIIEKIDRRNRTEITYDATLTLRKIVTIVGSATSVTAKEVILEDSASGLLRGSRAIVRFAKKWTPENGRYEVTVTVKERSTGAITTTTEIFDVPTPRGTATASTTAAGGVLMGAGGIMTALAFVAMKSRVKVKV